MMASLLDGLNGGHAAAPVHPSALPANRLDSLLSSLDSANPAQLERLLNTLSQSNILTTLPSDQSQHKLTVRINSLISSQKVAGYRLANQWLSQNSAIWHAHLVNHASSWLNHAIDLLTSPATHNNPNSQVLDAMLQLITNHVLTENSPSRQEFHRQAVTPNLQKFASGLFDAASAIITRSDPFAHSKALYHLIKAMHQQVQVHPSAYRALAPRIFTLCNDLLFISERLRLSSGDPPRLPTPLVIVIVKLLSSLHLTGALTTKTNDGANSRATQSQLWQSTIHSHLQFAQDAWRACVSSYELGPAEQEVITESLPALPKDPLVATQLALSRLELLLGSQGKPGVLPLLLRTPTSRPVPVPIGALLSFALSILHVDVSTPQKPTAEMTLCSLQAAYLPRLYLASLTLIAQVVLLSPSAVSLHAAEILTELCKVLETSRGSPRLRMATFRVVATLVGTGERGANIPLDPAGRITLRLAKLCVAQIAGFLLTPTNVADTPTTASGSSRKAKKARLYESDSVFGSSSNPKDTVSNLQPEELALLQASLVILAAVFPYLATELSAKHHDLARTSLQVVIALVEILADSQSTNSAAVLCTALDTTSSILRDSSSSMLALSLPRLTPMLLTLSLSALNAQVRLAAAGAVSALNLARKGKMVPIARGLGFYSLKEMNADFDSTPEGSKLPDRTALQEGNIIPTEGVTPLGRGLPSSPPAKTQSPRIFSPDPVKPSHRPMTLRIGSPNSAARTPADDAESMVADVFGAKNVPSPQPVQEEPVQAETIMETVVVQDAPTEMVAVPEEPVTVTETIVEQETLTEPAVNTAPEHFAFTGANDGDEDDDEEMPQIDMGESDDDQEEPLQLE